MACRNDTEPVPQLLLLEEFLCPVHADDTVSTCCSLETTRKQTKFLLRGRAIVTNVQIFQVPARELCVCDDLDLPISLLADLHRITEIVRPVVDLYLIMKELLERRDVEDLVGGGLGGIDDKLSNNFFMLESYLSHVTARGHAPSL